MLTNFTFTLSNTLLGLDSDCPTLLNLEFLLQGGLLPSFDSASSLLGSSTSKSKSIGFYLGVGIGKKWYTKMSTLGMQFNWANDKSVGLSSLIDINGDGLLDIVTKDEDGSLYYKKHVINKTYDNNNEPIITHVFQSKIKILGIDNFYRAYGRSKSSNFQVTFGSGRAGGFVGADISESKSENDIYFADGNGDGLIDIIRNQVVYFNRLNSDNTPEFIADSKNTENLVITAKEKEIEIPDEYNQSSITLPAYDVVKVWEAPADGSIKIENTIELTDLTKEAIVTIEKKTENVVNTFCYKKVFIVKKPFNSMVFSFIINQIIPLYI